MFTMLRNLSSNMNKLQTIFMNGEQTPFILKYLLLLLVICVRLNLKKDYLINNCGVGLADTNNKSRIKKIL
jgi:hypothetical protein